jgi:hypothetical protein
MGAARGFVVVVVVIVVVIVVVSWQSEICYLGSWDAITCRYTREARQLLHEPPSRNLSLLRSYALDSKPISRRSSGVRVSHPVSFGSARDSFPGEDPLFFFECLLSTNQTERATTRHTRKSIKGFIDGGIL